MDWLAAISNLVSRVPFERILIRPKDNVEALEKFINSRPTTEPQEEGASEGKSTSTTIQEPPKAPEIEPQSHTAGPGVIPEETTAASVLAGTACLPCCRDHLSTSSSALSEGMRFARDKGVKDPEALRRIRIALDELNVMERIDLAPDETVKLKGAEKDLADWTLKGSREIRHAITAIKDVDSMEQAAARASAITEEFISRLWAIPEEECETCGPARESIRQFVEKRKREREG